MNEQIYIYPPFPLLLLANEINLQFTISQEGSTNGSNQAISQRKVLETWNPGANLKEALTMPV